MVAIKPTIGLCKRTAGLEEGNRKPKHPLLAAGLRFWPPTLCFRGKLRSFYLFEGMGSFSLIGSGLLIGFALRELFVDQFMKCEHAFTASLSSN